MQMAGIASFQNNAQRLGNPNLPRIQRQMMAGRIGQQQGNGHLGQVVVLTQQRQRDIMAQPKRVQTKKVGAANGLNTKAKVHIPELHQSQVNESTATEEQQAREPTLAMHSVAGGASSNPGSPPLTQTTGNELEPPGSGLLDETTSPAVANQGTVQRWGLSDLVPDSVKKIGRGIAKAASNTWDKVANVAQIALDYAAKKASSIPGYTLLTFVLGKDPIADQEVPRTPMNLVRGVVGLIPGGEQLFKNLQESNVLQQVFDWLDEQLTKLNLTWTYVQGLFSKAWQALSIGDFVPPAKAFNKIKGIFSPLIGKIKNFAIAAGDKIWEMALESALKLAGPGGGQVMVIIKKAGAAFGKIIKDPIGFLGNLISGVGQGIEKFGGRILDHLKNGFVAWLTGAAPGLRIQMPDDIFSLSGMFSLVTQVLGLTWDYIRQKAVKLLGERVVSYAEKAFEPFQILITQGPGGLWEYLKGQLSSMAEMVVDQVKDLMITQAIQAGIKWVMGLLSPAGALLKAAKAIYDIVMFVIDKAGQIGDFVGAMMNSISAIASGAVGSAASLIERALAKALPLVISLLANLAGMGDIANKVMGVIRKVKAKIDGVIDKLIGKVKRLFGGEKKQGTAQSQNTDTSGLQIDSKFQLADGTHELKNRKNSAELTLASDDPKVLDGHPNKDVRDAYIQYKKAIAAATSPSARQKVANQHVEKIIAKIKAVGLANSPLASAPGVGEIQKHGDKQISLHKSGIPLWHLISEHILPYGTAISLWEVIGFGRPARGGIQDRKQTTIFIYKGAADEKTKVDNVLIDELKASIQKHDVALKFKVAVERFESTGDKTAYNDALEIIHVISDELKATKVSAVERTIKAINSEHKSNGTQRAEKVPVPSRGQVEQAAETQYKDINTLILKEILAQFKSGKW